ncbi:MAG: ORF6N domain-containing protein [Bacilli bacterium]|nr:ORF6N domain-containing protein [Bacilli bacterium]
MNEVIDKDNKTIEDMIYEIRGKQVMLDSDLAKLYCVETKRINEAVKNNLDKFPVRFSWFLTDNEWVFLRSKISTLEGNLLGKGHHRKYLPRVFTEQGIAMLATIIKSKIAIQTSINIMDAFVAMRHYIGNSELRITNLETKVIEHDSNIKLLQESFDKLEENKEINEIYFNGKIYDAYSKVLDIFSNAKKELIIIDRYADKTILDMIKKLNCKIILITSRNSKLTDLDIKKYNSSYHNLTIYYDDTYHDRYFILDKEIIYHSGNSINHIGYRKSSINTLNDISVKKSIIEDIDKIIKR